VEHGQGENPYASAEAVQILNKAAILAV
jgi:hypothetical protein